MREEGSFTARCMSGVSGMLRLHSTIVAESEVNEMVKEDPGTGDEPFVDDEGSGPSYEPPTIEVLGPVEQLTTGRQVSE